MKKITLNKQLIQEGALKNAAIGTGIVGGILGASALGSHLGVNDEYNTVAEGKEAQAAGTEHRVFGDEKHQK